MSQYFLYNYDGPPFVLFGSGHLLSIGFFILLNLALLTLRRASEKTRRAVRVTMAIILWVNEAAWHVWNLYWGQWTIQKMLPLHVCSIMIWLAGFMLIFKNYRIYEFAYFLGIGGALQAFLTPDAGIYGFPHFRVFQTQIAHGLLITSAIYMTVVEGFRPTWKSMLRVIVVGNLVMAVVFGLNFLLDSNYMFLRAKPETASLLDVLPDWPVYIIFLEIIGLAVFLILYLPFVIKDRQAKKQTADQIEALKP